MNSDSVTLFEPAAGRGRDTPNPLPGSMLNAFSVSSLSHAIFETFYRPCLQASIIIIIIIIKLPSRHCI